MGHAENSDDATAARFCDQALAVRVQLGEEHPHNKRAHIQDIPHEFPHEFVCFRLCKSVCE